jgi:hypothetical protein
MPATDPLPQGLRASDLIGRPGPGALLAEVHVGLAAVLRAAAPTVVEPAAVVAVADERLASPGTWPGTRAGGRRRRGDGRVRGGGGAVRRRACLAGW